MMLLQSPKVVSTKRIFGTDLESLLKVRPVIVLPEKRTLEVQILVQLLVAIRLVNDAIDVLAID